MRAISRRSRTVALIAFAAAGSLLERHSLALTPVTFSGTGGATTNWSTVTWSDASNPASNIPQTVGDAYNVSSGQSLYSPTITATTGTDYFYGGALNLTSATLNFNGSSASTDTRQYNFPNLSSGAISSTDSTIIFTSTNGTTHNLSTGIAFSDTGSNSNYIKDVSTQYTNNVNLQGPISGSGTVNFNFSGGTGGHTVSITNATNTYTGAVVLGPTVSASTFNLTKTLGTVSSYTIGSLWTMSDAASNNINGSNISLTGALTIAGTAETLGNVSGAGSITATSSSAIALALNGGGTLTGNLIATAGTLSLTKTSAGVQVLSGTDNYTGTTTISSGTLQLGKEVSLYNDNSGNWTAGNITVSSGATLGLNVGGTGQFTSSHVSTLAGLSSGSGGFQAGSFLALDTSNASGGVFTYSNPISNPGGNSIGLTKLGTGSLDLTVSNTYTGLTTVAAGTLILDSSSGNSGALASPSTAVLGGATLLVKGNTGIGGGLSLAGGANVSSQAVLDLRDTTINTFNISGNLTLGSGSYGSILDLDIGTASGSNDAINVSGGVTVNGLTTINLNALGSLAYGNYTLITDTTGGLTGGAGFILGTRPIGPLYSLASSTADDLILTVSMANSTPPTAYWTGLASASGGDTSNNWGFGGSSTNWSSTAAGTTDTGAQPGSISNVIFTAANASSVAGVLSTQLDTNYSINSLTFNTASAAGITSVGINTNVNTLTIGTGGLTVASTDTSNSTISGSSSSVLLGASQAWANNASSHSLTVSAGIAGTATTGTETLTFSGTGAGGVVLSGAISDGTGGGNLALVFDQAGVTQLSGTNTFTGGVTIGAGTVRLVSGAAFNATTPNAIVFAPGSTGDLQLDGNSLTLSSFNTDPTTPASPIVENASSTPVTLNINASSGTNTFAGVLQNGTGGGALSLTLSGASTLVLSGTSTYTGTTTLAAGTLSATTATAFSPASSLAFTGASTLLINGFPLTTAGLTVSGSTSFTPTLAGATAITVNATASTVIGGTAGGITDTLDVSAFNSFTYNGSSGVTLYVGSTGTTLTGGNGALLLAANSTITAGAIGVDGSSTQSSGSSSSTGALTLGQSNVINTNTLVVGSRQGGSATGTISFSSSLTNATLTLDGFAGAGSTVNITVGDDVNSDYSVGVGVIDLSGGTANASIGTMLVGVHGYADVNFAESGTGTVTLGAGTVTAKTIELGVDATGSGHTGTLGSGTLNIGTGTIVGGTLQVGTLTLGDQQVSGKTYTSAVTGIVNFNGGLLEAGTIQPGATQTTGTIGTITRTFNWNAGTIQNYNSTSGLSITLPTITTASGVNTFDITAGQTGTVSSNISGGGMISKVDSGTLTLLGGSNTYTGGTVVTGGTLNLSAVGALPLQSNLNIGSGAAVVATAMSPATAVSVNSLTVTGKLDLTNNGLIVHSSTLTAVNASVASGYNGATWNSTSGIVSSTAAADSTHLTALGTIVNDNGMGTNTPLYGSGGTLSGAFEGQSPVDGDILVKYTYYGDANLNGEVDGSDYSLIDNGFLNHLAGWYNGDFNYDGVVNGSDYTLMDNAFNQQGAQIASEIAGPNAAATAEIAGAAGTSAVPEPATLGVLIGISTAGLLGRRRRRR